MSTIQVDRIIPYQSSSVTIEGDVTALGAATTGSNTFTGDQNILGTITASIQEGYAWVGGVGNVSILAATSSFGGASTDITALNAFTASQEALNTTFATTGSNDFQGNQVINGGNLILGSGNLQVTGSASQTFPVPASNTGTPLIQVTGGVAPGTHPNAVYGYVKNQWLNSQGGNSYLGWIWENWDTPSYGFGNDTVIGPTGLFHDLYASGSGQNAQLRIRDNYNGTTFAQLYAGTLRLGANANTSTLVIGRNGLETQVSGSVSVETALTLAPQDSLPVGTLGQLAVSGSSLYFYDGTWRQVSLV